MGTGDVLPSVEWGESSTSPRNYRAILTVVGLLVIAGFFLRSYLAPETANTTDPDILTYEINRLEWLWLGSLWATTVYLGGSIVSNPERAIRLTKRLRNRPVTLAATVVTLVIFLAGTIGPAVLQAPTPSFAYRNQPPLFTSVPRNLLVDCYNPVGTRCFGSWRHPLGTGRFGEGYLRRLVFGARNVVQIAMVALTLIVPLATLVGTISAYVGGRIDRALTGVAESLKAIPALLVFFVWRWLTGDGTPFMLVVSFGLVNWGSVATVVRSRAIDEVAKDYVKAARASGASSIEIVRWHVLPNVAGTAIANAVYQVPLFITIEATLSYLTFGAPPSPLLLTPTSFTSWGDMIGENIGEAGLYWWRVALPIAALFVTILATSVLAKGVQEILDPRRDAEG